MMKNRASSGAKANKIMIYILGGYLSFIFIAFLIIAVLASISVIAPVPSANKDMVARYQQLASQIDGDWALMMAYDTVKTKNHLKEANPDDTAIRFLVIKIQRFNLKGELVSTVFLNSKSAIARYMKKSEASLTLSKVLGYFNGIKSPWCTVEWRGKNIKDLENELTDKELNYLIDITAGDAIEKVYGEKVKLPSFIQTDAVGFFALPAPEFTRVSSSFGTRYHPRLKKFKFHAGIDLAGPRGSPIIAAAGGIVLKAADDPGGYGNFVVIRHTDPGGKVWTTLYGHMDALYVGRGSSVERGTVIGALGNTGLSTGPHLHFEIRFNNQAVDPALFLNKSYRDYKNEPR